MDVALPGASWKSRAGQYALEAAVAIAAAMVMLAAGTRVNINPTDRIAQVSGMAQLQLAVALIAVVGVLAFILVERRGWISRQLLIKIGCAAVAGLATGLVGGGVAEILRGTPYGLWAGTGDYAWIDQWAYKIMGGVEIPHYYPPLFIKTLAWWSEFSGKPPAYAVRDLQMVGTSLFGPAAYLAWRLVLKPGWALGIGVVAAFPFIEPVKPYTQVVLVMLIPVIIAFLRRLRYGDALSTTAAVWTSVAYGIGFGLLFLLYSGWFVWAAAGALAAMVIVTPWRRALGRSLLILGVTGISFVATSWIHLFGILGGDGGTSDAYIYFDTYTDPAYFAMWRNDVPGKANAAGWPPPAEWAGVGLFTILLMLGLAAALWLGWKRTPVIALGLIAASAWIMRMYLAGTMYGTHTVRLYPRTTMVLLFACLLFVGFAIKFAVDKAWPTKAWKLPTMPVGIALIPILAILAMAGSRIVDEYWAGPGDSYGGYARAAHDTEQFDRQCPTYHTKYPCEPFPR